MVHVYAMNIQNLPDPKEEGWVLGQLTAERKQRTMKYMHADDRKRSLGAGILLQEILPRFGASPDNVYLGADGKPEVDGVSFNLSHSGSLVICAAASKQVGCDIEVVQKAPRYVAERFFCRQERDYLKSCKEELQDREFFRIWTMKESYMKMTGEGMRLPLDRFAIVFAKDMVSVQRDGVVQDCFIKEYAVPGYQVSVCAQEHQFVAQIEDIPFLGEHERRDTFHRQSVTV